MHHDDNDSHRDSQCKGSELAVAIRHIFQWVDVDDPLGGVCLLPPQRNSACRFWLLFLPQLAPLSMLEGWDLPTCFSFLLP